MKRIPPFKQFLRSFSKQHYVPTSGTYPQGFRVGTAHAGVKPSNTGADDIALLVSDPPSASAAVFTRNLFRAGPVDVSKRILQKRTDQTFRGVVINSGCANAVTGPSGRRHAAEMAVTADRCIDGSSAPTAGVDEDWGGEPPRTLVMSTGVIGQPLPIERVTEAIPKAYANLSDSHDSWMDAAQAICTTDTFPKLRSRTFSLPSHSDKEYRIGGFCKGAGMVHPNLGTMLAVIATDVKIADADSMKLALKIAVDSSFNCISIDGDTSTNDTVALFANGAAAPPDVEPLRYFFRGKGFKGRGQRSRVPHHEPTEDEKAFLAVLRDFMTDLAQLVVRDGEGATKFVTVRVRSTHSLVIARRAASSIATSALVKTAIHGRDANWGRILAAIGYAPGLVRDPQRGVPGNSNSIDPVHTSVSFLPQDKSEPLSLLVRGQPQDVDEARAKRILDSEDVEIFVDLNDSGKNTAPKKEFEAVYWTCDLSAEYVDINGSYRT